MYMLTLQFISTGFLQTHMSQLKHTLNTAYIVWDLFISAMPIRVFHLIYPMFVGAIYTVFNALYFINDGTGPGGKPYAYYVMDWRNPIESAVTCSLGFVLTTVVQSILYGIYRLRLYLFQLYLQRQGAGETEGPIKIITSSSSTQGLGGVEDTHKEDQCLNGVTLGGSVDGGRNEESECILGEHRSPTTYHAVDSAEVIEMIDEAPHEDR